MKNFRSLIVHDFAIKNHKDFPKLLCPKKPTLFQYFAETESVVITNLFFSVQYYFTRSE